MSDLGQPQISGIGPTRFPINSGMRDLTILGTGFTAQSKVRVEGLYLTSRFMAHDEKNEAKIGDKVALVSSRPMSRRKRWVVTRVIAKAPKV